jgi:hypothetical protein
MIRTAAMIGFTASIGLISLGCPPASNGVAKVTTMFTGDSQSVANALIGALAAKDGPVNVDDIESLTVKITEINLDYSGDAGDMDDGDNGDGTSKVNVFEGCEIVDLIQLEGVNRLISLDEAPAGKYTKIRISFEDPVLVLKSDPSTELTNVHLTANGRLFISQMFDLPAEQQSVLLIDFGGLHLVMNGNGNFVLTPQLAVDLEVGVIEDTTVMGMITEIDSENDLLTLMVEGGELLVDCTGASIFLVDDTDTPNGDKSDLVVDQKVEVMGLLFPDDILEASSVRILPDPEPEPMP